MKQGAHEPVELWSAHEPFAETAAFALVDAAKILHRAMEELFELGASSVVDFSPLDALRAMAEKLRPAPPDLTPH